MGVSGSEKGRKVIGSRCPAGEGPSNLGSQWQVAVRQYGTKRGALLSVCLAKPDIKVIDMWQVHATAAHMPSWLVTVM